MVSVETIWVKLVDLMKKKEEDEEEEEEKQEEKTAEANYRPARVRVEGRGGICHQERQNGATQGKAAWGGGRWRVPGAGRGRTGATPRKTAAAPRALAACPVAELRARRPPGSGARGGTTTAKHSVPSQLLSRKLQVLQEAEMNYTQPCLPGEENVCFPTRNDV
ncbi:PREDICTED: uncharacterized protein LOC105516616 [Colobus angolensis palliatus]|uniref:uncharacterized protein LOC105516616 n=1 Tax=Colobus angolensis palliatus TaxID=336983 RepID=UPI0005F51B85|nr:PREDICTED: uncharacterized protein LOC105516616 [Colobus angolensis palliatus]